jgi:hypothetical protein
MAQRLSPAQFIAKWSPVTLSERAASHEHFIDLCRMLGQPTPADHDATGGGFPLPDNHALSDRRKEIDQLVLANLLRLNLARR